MVAKSTPPADRLLEAQKAFESARAELIAMGESRLSLDQTVDVLSSAAGALGDVVTEVRAQTARNQELREELAQAVTAVHAVSAGSDQAVLQSEVRACREEVAQVLQALQALGAPEATLPRLLENASVAEERLAAMQAELASVGASLSELVSRFSDTDATLAAMQDSTDKLASKVNRHMTTHSGNVIAAVRELGGGLKDQVDRVVDELDDLAVRTDSSHSAVMDVLRPPSEGAEGASALDVLPKSKPRRFLSR